MRRGGQILLIDLLGQSDSSSADGVRGETR
jgi:hypothetical protein